MAAPARTLTLGKPPAAPAEAARDLAAELYAAKAPEAPIVAEKPLTPRTVDIRVKLRNPATGKVEAVTLTSTAPNAAKRQEIVITAAQMHRGIPASELDFHDRAYFNALARIVRQCEPLPESERWILDDVGAVCAIGGELVRHDQLYFRGDDGEGDAGSPEPVVECPWSNAHTG